MNNRTFFASTGIVVLLFNIGQAMAMSHASRPLDIKTNGTQIFACIPLDEDDVVEVTDAGVAAVGGLNERLPPMPWVIKLRDLATPLKLKPGQCLEFHKLPDGYTNTSPDSDLQDDFPYSFGIRSDDIGKYGTRNHTGEFCISRSGGSIRLVQIPRSPAVITTSTCKQLLESIHSP